MPEHPSDPLLLTEDLAKLAGCSGTAIRAAVKTGRLEPYDTTPGGVRIFKFSTALKFAATRDRVSHLKGAMKQAWRPDSK